MSFTQNPTHYGNLEGGTTISSQSMYTETVNTFFVLYYLCIYKNGNVDFSSWHSSIKIPNDINITRDDASLWKPNSKLGNAVTNSDKEHNGLFPHRITSAGWIHHCGLRSWNVQRINQHTKQGRETILATLKERGARQGLKKSSQLKETKQEKPIQHVRTSAQCLL